MAEKGATKQQIVTALRGLIAAIDAIGDRVRGLMVFNVVLTLWFAFYVYQNDWGQTALWASLATLLPALLLAPVLFLIRSLQEIEETTTELQQQLKDTGQSLRGQDPDPRPGLIRNVFRLRHVMALVNVAELSGHYGTLVMLCNPLSITVMLVAVALLIALAIAAFVTLMIVVF